MASAVIRREQRQYPPPDLLMTGSRYAGSSESYGRFVTSDHVPVTTGSCCVAARADLIAPPGTVVAGAMRAASYSSDARLTSSSSSDALLSDWSCRLPERPPWASARLANDKSARIARQAARTRGCLKDMRTLPM